VSCITHSSTTPLARWLANRDSILADTQAAHALLKQANGAGEHLRVVEIGESILAAGKVDPTPVLQQMARALAVLGSSEQARLILGRIPAGRADAAETAGLLGRIEKDLAAAAQDSSERTRHLENARASYLSGHAAAVDSGDSEGAAYCGINAAAISVLLDDLPTAKDLADKTLGLIGDRVDFYSVATKAEARLILGGDETFAAYRQAADLAAADKRWADLASTRKQCRELSLKLYGRRDHCDECFPPGAIGMLTGEPVDHPLVDPLRSKISEWFELHSVREVYGTPKPGWDIALLEIARLAGIDTHIILPLPEKEFIRSETHLNDGSWLSRFTSVLNDATSVTVLDADTVGSEFTDRMIAARASLLADHLGFNLRALAVGESFERTAVAVWQRSNLELRAIRPSEPAADALPDKQSPPDAIPFQRALAPANRRTRFAVIAHFHFAAYEELSGPDFASFQQTVLGTIANRLALSSHPPVSKEGFAGDYRFVFERLHDAATTCIDLIEALHASNDEASGKTFPPPSVCLNAGPLRQLINPVLNFYSDEGSVASRAAKIARQLPEGSLTATETFVALTSLESIRGFRFEHAGKISVGAASERIFRVYPSAS
jgi:hypothetical protein